MQPFLRKEETGSELPWQLFWRCSPCWEVLWHYHREIELFVPRSTGEYAIGDRVGVLKKGEAYLLGSGLPHTFHGEGGSPLEGDQKAWVLFFEGDAPWRSMLGALPELDDLLFHAGRGLRWCSDDVEDLSNRLDRLNQASGIEAGAAFFSVLQWLLGAGPGAPVCSPGLQREALGRDTRLDRVCSYLAQHVDDADLRLETIVKATGWSSATLERMFCKCFEKSVFRYVQDLRLGRVCRDLMETEHGITTIAMRRGFNTLAHFNRIFRREFGCSPSEYRKRLQVQGEVGKP